MHIDDFNRTKTDLNTAIEKIKLNKTDSFRWYAVENSVGCPFEIGGCNRKELNLKAYIPEFKDNLMVIYKLNNFINHEYSIEKDLIAYSYANCYQTNLLSSNEILIKFLDNRDFRINPIKIEPYTVMVMVATTEYKIII